jgi:uncharacterized membrane protein YfcA
MTLLFPIGLMIVGLIAGFLLASTGTIGPFLLPALLLLGLPTGLSRGTTLVGELLITVTALVGHRKVGNLDKRVILAFLPGATVVALGAGLSVQVPVPLMNLLIGIFEIIIGAALIYQCVRSAKDERFKPLFGRRMIGKLVIIAIVAGFTKGFLGAGWGPIGVGLFIVAGIDPRLAIGSSLVIRLLLDVVGGVTYAYMNLVDVNAVIILALTGCLGSLVAARVTVLIPKKPFTVFLGAVIMLLGALVILMP